VLYLPQDTHPSAVFFVHTSKGGALSDILYFWLSFMSDFLEYPNHCDFSDLAISECSFLIVALVIYNVVHVLS